jgi:polyhydroxybutyrate depolymerase
MDLCLARSTRLAALAFNAGGLLAVTLAAQSPLVRDTITAGGRMREYFVAAPDANAQRPAPLVLFLHGRGYTAPGASKHQMFDAVAVPAGAIVVYPQGIDNHWNDGRDYFRDGDDITFIRALLARLRARLRIDSTRVFVVGWSNGGIMAYTLACRLPGTFAAVGTVGGALPVNDLPRCANATPASVIAIHGTEDPLVYYDGGGQRGAMLGAEKNVAFWARLAGCDSTPTRTDLPPHSPSSATHATRIEFANCARGRAVVLYELVGAGHGWPGESGPMPDSIVGPPTEAVVASPLIWDFLSAHPERAPD